MGKNTRPADGKCLVEQFLLELFDCVLVHDGLPNSEKANLPQKQLNFYTSRYRVMKKDGTFTPWWLKFIYDNRTGRFVDFKVEYKDKDKPKQSQVMSQQGDLEKRIARIRGNTK